MNGSSRFGRRRSRAVHPRGSRLGIAHRSAGRIHYRAGFEAGRVPSVRFRRYNSGISNDTLTCSARQVIDLLRCTFSRTRRSAVPSLRSRMEAKPRTRYIGLDRWWSRRSVLNELARRKTPCTSLSLAEEEFRQIGTVLRLMPVITAVVSSLTLSQSFSTAKRSVTQCDNEILAKSHPAEVEFATPRPRPSWARSKDRPRGGLAAV